MARKRVFNMATPVKMQGKLERLLIGRISEETALTLARLGASQWNESFGVYKRLYEQMKTILQKQFPDVPHGQYGLYRSFMLKAYKSIPKGADPEALISDYVKITGVREDVLRYLLDYFGLITERSGEETAPTGR
ncbi:MAG: hypothetical protein CBR30_09690 [Dictyoglomus sp. NZ13-RE01]|nr:MAG: hypothetical protein CBR30_09690 [Dictyoglomus sp. NZ13-RE01]